MRAHSVRPRPRRPLVPAPSVLSAALALLLALAVGELALDPAAQATQAGSGGAAAGVDALPGAGVHASTQAGGTSRNAGNNPNTLSMILPPVIGAALLGRLDYASTGHAVGLVIAYLTPANVTLPGGQVLLVNVLDPAGAVVPFTPADPFGTFVVFVPPDPTLCGLTPSMQGVHVDPLQQANFLLSNALDLVIGF